jgi:hypothetical protein
VQEQAPTVTITRQTDVSENRGFLGVFGLESVAVAVEIALENRCTRENERRVVLAFLCVVITLGATNELFLQWLQNLTLHSNSSGCPKRTPRRTQQKSPAVKLS